ncbi:hypothetical protein [Acetobacter tropicalis]|uniref:hypothetical protein n=1 Tax=Acetobacter tropicalis TaxID=104102 RepID=UPI000B11397C|nr:hypothetical protein [Acetobacter tropicalis]
MIDTRSRYTCTPTQVPRPHPAHLSAGGEAAELIGASVRTLEKYRCTSGGPPVLRFLGAIWVVRLGGGVIGIKAVMNVTTANGSF